MPTLILFFVIAVALLFEFINGFHDTANAIATSVYTRAMTARQAIILAAVMNFIGALISDKVALTITHGLVNIELEQYVILGALIGAIIWNLFTWWKGIPSSSSHALIGSLIGATMVYTMGIHDINWSGVVQKVVIPLVTSPFLGLFGGFAVMKLLCKIFEKWERQKANRLFPKLQIFSAAFVAFSHGNNDAQKTMGIITLALMTGGLVGIEHGVPFWVKVACACMMALGTSLGGWRIMKSMGSGVTKLNNVGGFAAQTASAIVIEIMTHFGAPISTTQVITSAVMGVGSAKRLSAVRWSFAKGIVMAWVITLPTTIVLGGLSVYIVELFV
ncbi:MAG: inorganic phosphate transporter [Clostridiales Family XIII bacterium]|jgi:PiT family inorganic phosphate transporter|nr:inorganic phosphate transporter [Clostridiales Family XIII bacterium]